MPFNAQLHESDVKRGYKVPNPFPRPPQPTIQVQQDSNNETNCNKTIRDTYDEFIEVFARSKVIVTEPSDGQLLDRIHKTIEYLLKEGPVFEAIVIAREGKNPAFSFLYNNQSQEHVYYRWKLYSLLHGEDCYFWRTEEFRMFEGGPLWRPPPLNPYAEGMPQELIDEAISDFENFIGSKNSKTVTVLTENSMNKKAIENEEPRRVKGHLSVHKRELLDEKLRTLVPTKSQIGSAMLLCINYADAANDIIDVIYQSLKSLDTPFPTKLARLFLISDILHNCSAAVTNASFYRKGFQAKLVSIFEHLREYLVSIEDSYKADRFKQKILIVLGAWKEWTLYEDEFLIQLSNILLGLKQQSELNSPSQQDTTKEQLELIKPINSLASSDVELDGVPVDDVELANCLESKGLSLRWYRALELSDNEDEADGTPSSSHNHPDSRSSTLNHQYQSSKGDKSDPRKSIRFKSSKWETVDPVEVIEQVVTMSKWNAMAKAEDESALSTSTGDSSPVGSCNEGESTNDPSSGVRKKSRLMERNSDGRKS